MRKSNLVSFFFHSRVENRGSVFLGWRFFSILTRFFISAYGSFVDSQQMSSKYISAGGSKYWLLAVDEATHMKFSMFLEQKSEVKESFVPFLKELWHTYGIKIEHIRCDNAGENHVLEDLCIEKDLGIILNIQHQEHHNKTE